MLVDLQAVSNIRGERIDLDWTWQAAGPRPALRLVRRRRAFPAGPDDGLTILDLGQLFAAPNPLHPTQDGEPWARIERSLYIAGEPDAPAESGLLQAEMALYFATPTATEPGQAVIRYYDAGSGRLEVVALADVSRVVRTEAPAAPWAVQVTLEIMTTAGGGPESSAGRVVVSTGHADATMPNLVQWIPAAGPAASLAFDWVDGHQITSRDVRATPTSFRANLALVRDTVVQPLATLDELFDPDLGEWRRRVILADEGLAGETVYYYALFRLDAGTSPGPSGLGPEEGAWRVSAVATGRYGFGERLYGSLPALHLQYDEPLATGAGTAGRPLQRFLEIFGAALDQVRSQAEGLRGRHDLLAVRHDLLPHLAHWIGWDLDFTADVLSQRQDILLAPEIYTTVGTLPNVCALVDRITGWQCQVKEFVHNVLLTNAPETIHLWEIWTQEHDGAAWGAPGAVTAFRPEGLDGRPAAAVDAAGVPWLFWHGDRRGRREIWLQRLDGLDPEPRPASGSTVEPVPYTDEAPAAVADGTDVWLFWSSDRSGSHDLWARLYQNGSFPGGAPLRLTMHAADDRDPAAVRASDGRIWLFWSSDRRGPADIWAMSTEPGDAGAWGLPQRLTTAVFRHETPAAVVDGSGRIWLFWSADLGDRTNIYCRRLEGGTWTPAEAVTSGPWRDQAPAVAVHLGEIWLFWHSNRDGRWQVWQQRHDPLASPGAGGTAWGSPEQVTSHVTGDKDPAAVVDGGGGLRLFWRSQRRGQRNQSRTFDTADAELRSSMRTFDDRVHYTYDAGRDDDDWYARDTVGLYVTPNTEEEALLAGTRNPLDLVRPFLPIQVRAVLLVRPAVYRDAVYTYDLPGAEPQRHIGELFFDAQLAERLPAQADAYVDTAPDWAWMSTWSPATAGHQTVDVTEVPIVTRFRIWQPGVEAGG